MKDECRERSRARILSGKHSSAVLHCTDASKEPSESKQNLSLCFRSIPLHNKDHTQKYETRSLS